MSRPDYDAIIIGAGVSGLCSAIQLERKLGLSNTLIIDRAEDVGGTWWNNQYPGCGCDIPTRLYSLSFEQRRNWDRFFSLQPEIHQYFQGVARKYKLYERAALRTEAKTATWNKSTKLWEVEYQSIVPDAAGNRPAPVVKTCRVLVSGMGALSVPREIGIKGAEKFKGPVFHSARWDHSVNVKGKNVVVIGNGCSATQIVPQIAPLVKQLTQVVRSKHWMSPQVKFAFAKLTWLQKYVPGWIYLERFIVAIGAEAHFLQADIKYGKGARQRYADVCRKYVETYAPEEYHELLLPKETEVQVACKRRIFDDGYIPSLNRNNVALTNKRAVEITEDSVLLEDGTSVPADIIVHANGFKTETFSLQMDIRGQDMSLAEYWKTTKTPQAYRGSMVSGFPNLFVIWGPNTATGHFSAIWTIESTVELMTTVLRPCFARDAQPTATVMPLKSAEEKEQRYIQDVMSKKVYTTGCGAWYTDPETGRVTALAPCTQYTWQTRCRYPVLSDMKYTGIGSTPYAYVSIWKRLNMLLGRGDIYDPNDQSRIGKLLRAVINLIKMRLYVIYCYGADQLIGWEWPKANPKHKKLQTV